MMEFKPYVHIGNKIYAMNLQKIADFCLVSDKLKNKESEVTEGYEVNDENGPELVSKVVREIKTNGKPNLGKITSFKNLTVDFASATLTALASAHLVI